MTGAVPVEPVALALAHGCWFLPALDAVGRTALAPAGRVRLREGGWLVWAAGVLTSPWHAQPVGLDVWVPGPWLLALGLPGLWGVARWLASWWALRRLPTEPAGTFRGVRVEVGAVSVPLTWGLEPRIVLPHASADWSPEHRIAVLAHEHGHVVRRDYVRLAGSTLLGVVLGACPAFAWSLRCQRRDVEQAADAVAVRSVAPRAYAQALLDLGRVPASVPAAALSVQGGLGARIEAVLTPEPRRWPLVGTLVAATLSVGLLAGPAWVPAPEPPLPPPCGP